jgi:hypothetical protein
VEKGLTVPFFSGIEVLMILWPCMVQTRKLMVLDLLGSKSSIFFLNVVI